MAIKSVVKQYCIGQKGNGAFPSLPHFFNVEKNVIGYLKITITALISRIL